MLRLLKKFLSSFSKIVFIVAVCVVIVNIFLGFILKKENKQTQSVNPITESRKEIYRNINNPVYQKTKEGKIMVTIYRAGMCGLLGEACTDNPADGDRFYTRSLFGSIGNLLAFPYSNPPASGIYWAYSGLQQVGFVPKTLATDGIGFSSLQPISALWVLFRNIAFTILVLFMVVLGLLIMFRFKINPQTVITASNALPRVVIALLLITFSFAIGGFLIDLMYIVTIVGVQIVGKALLSQDVQQMFISSITTGGTARLFDLVFWNGETFKLGGALFSLMPPIINQIVRVIAVGGVLWLLKSPNNPVGKYLLGGESGWIATCDGVCGFFISLATWVIIPGLVYLFLPLILSLFILVTTGLFVFFRILFMLFSAYMRIIVSIIFSPIILLMEVIPGRNTFSKWIRALLADLILFPLTLILITLSTAILNMNNNFLYIWQPPFLYTGVNQSAFNVLVGIGLMFMIPDIGRIMRELFGIKGSPLKIGFGVFFAGAAGATSGTMNTLQKYYYSSAALKQLRGSKLGTSILGEVKKTEE